MINSTFFVLIFLFFSSCSHYDVNKITHHDMQEYIKNNQYNKNIKALLNKPVSYNNKILNELDLVFFYFINHEYEKTKKIIENIEAKIENGSLSTTEKINEFLISKEKNKYLLEEHEYLQLQSIKIMVLLTEKQFAKIMKIQNIYKNPNIYYLQAISAELNKDWNNAIVLYEKSDFVTKQLDIERIKMYKKGYPIIDETIIFYNSGLSPVKIAHQTHPTIPSYLKRLNTKNIYEISSIKNKYVSIPLMNFYNIAKNKELKTYKQNVYEDIFRFSFRELLALPIDAIGGGVMSIGTRLLLHTPDGGDFRYWEWSFEQIDISRVQLMHGQKKMTLKIGKERESLPSNQIVIINKPL